MSVKHLFRTFDTPPAWARWQRRPARLSCGRRCPCPPGCRVRTGTCPRVSPPMHAAPGRRVIENKRLPEIRL